MKPDSVSRVLQAIAGILTVTILVDQMLGGPLTSYLRMRLNYVLDEPMRRRYDRESWTPGAEDVIAEAQRITREERPRVDEG